MPPENGLWEVLLTFYSSCFGKLFGVIEAIEFFYIQNEELCLEAILSIVFGTYDYAPVPSEEPALSPTMPLVDDLCPFI